MYYTVRFYFGSTWRRWIGVFFFLVFIGILLKYTETDYFLPRGARLTFWDYVFSSLSNPFVMVLVLPLTFCYLVGDAVAKDYQGGYIEFLLTRLSSRVQYLGSKVILIVIASSSLFVTYLGALLVVTLLFRLPLHGPYFFDVVNSSLANDQSLSMLMVIQMALFILSFQALGVFIMAISILSNHVVFSYIGLVALILQGHDAVFNQHARLMYTLLAQGILSLHAPYYFYNANANMSTAVQSFTISYSVGLLFIASILLLVLSGLKTRKANLGEHR